MRGDLQALHFIQNTLGFVFFKNKIDMTNCIASFFPIKLDSKCYTNHTHLKRTVVCHHWAYSRQILKANCKGVT